MKAMHVITHIQKTTEEDDDQRSFAARLHIESSKLFPVTERLRPVKPVTKMELNAPVNASGSGSRPITTGQLTALKDDGESEGLSPALSSVLEGRRSSRDFATTEVTHADVSYLLRSYRSTSITSGALGKIHLRTAPSAGGLYPVHVYLAASRVEGVPGGVHHYDPLHGALESIALCTDTSDRLAKIIGRADYPTSAAGALLLTLRLEDAMSKYGERGYRYSLIEMGHVAQIFSLAASVRGLALICHGAFYDDLANRLVNANGSCESVAYVLLFANAKPSRHQQEAKK